MKQPCLILYSYRDVEDTGSAMTCRGFLLTETHEGWVNGEYETIFTESMTDKHGEPFPPNVFIWDYKIIEE